jgi:hypothetical protein
MFTKMLPRSLLLLTLHDITKKPDPAREITLIIKQGHGRHGQIDGFAVLLS